MRTLVGDHLKEVWTQGGVIVTVLPDGRVVNGGFTGAEGKTHVRVTVQDGAGDTLHATTAAPNTGPPYTYLMVRNLYGRYGFVTNDEIANAVFYPTGETADDRINRNIEELTDHLRTWDGLETSIKGLPGAVQPNLPGADRGLPLRWFQNQLNDQIEIEIPNVKSVTIDRSMDQDAGTCSLRLYNQKMLLDEESPIGEIGQPGYYTPSRGDTLEARARWRQQQNEWNARLRPMAVVRVYAGYGGNDKSIHDAVLDGNLVLAGVFFIDNVSVGTDGFLSVKARDPMKLLIDQVLYSPLIPHSKYPLKYYRWVYFNEAIRAAARSQDGITYDPVFIGADRNINGVGYLTSDGFFDVDAFGDARTYDRTGGSELNTYSAGTQIRQTRTGLGYYVLNGQGQVACYGDAVSYGDPWSDGYVAANGLNGVTIDMALTPSGNGYWVLDNFGHTFAFGDAVVFGSQRKIFTQGDNLYISIESHPSINGYWVTDIFGNVYPWPELGQVGTVGTYGQPAIDSWGTTAPLSRGVNDVVCLRATATGDGYWIMTSAGQVQAFGAAANRGSVADPVGSTDWQQKYWKLIPQSDGGYLVMRGDGRIFPIGTSYYFGDAVPGGVSTKRTNGNYTDYTQIVKDLLLWSGFLLEGATSAVPEHDPPYTDELVRSLYAAYGFETNAEIEAATFELSSETAAQRIARNIDELTSGRRSWGGLEMSIGILPGAVVPFIDPVVYGNLEGTGIWSDEPLPDAMFDKRPVIDALHEIKEIVGYGLWCDAEGAIRFEPPNVFGPGNYNEIGTHVDEIPDIDERVNLTNYTATVDDEAVRSEIILSSEDPDRSDGKTTITTRIRPSDAQDLRGLCKPALWVQRQFLNRDEQRIMAELIALQIHFQTRTGTATCAANPLLDVGDQVRITERQTSETFVHLIRQISFNWDLDSGESTMNLTTSWLGDGTEWGVIQKGGAGVDWAFRLSQKGTDWIQSLARNPARFPVSHAPSEAAA